MPCTSVIEEKQALRRRIKAAADAIPPDVRKAQDKALFKAFFGLEGVKRAKTILLFWGVGTEPETVGLVSALLASGKRVALPRCLPGGGMEARVYRGGRLVRNPHGIPEPGEECPLLAREEIDVILVPALCYDGERYRLGHGGGYYDRYLAGYEGLTVGLCYKELLQTRLPRQAHDLPVKVLLRVE